MHLNVNDPSLWPAEVQDLHVAPAIDDVVGAACESYALRSSERRHALLERCQADEWAMVMEHGEEVRIAVSQAWEVEVHDENGRPVAHRMLIPVGRDAPAEGALDPGVLTWAALGVLWHLSGRQPARG